MNLLKFCFRNRFFFLIILFMINLIGCSSSSPPIQEYQLTINRLGPGTFSPESGTKYKSGTVVPLNAIPEDGYCFYRWEGPDRELVSNNQVTMNKDISINAYFFKYGLIGKIYQDNQPKKLNIYLYLEFSYTIGSEGGVSGWIRSILETRSDGSFFTWYDSNELPTDDVTFYTLTLRDETEKILYQRQNVSIQEDLNDLGIIDLN